MRLGSTVLALALTGASAPPAWAIAGCDAFSAALRAGASDMGIEFSHAIVVSRNRSDANVFDVTTKVDVDATLSCRGDELLRFEARNQRAGQCANDDQLRTLSDGRFARGPGLGRRQKPQRPPRHERRRARVP